MGKTIKDFRGSWGRYPVVDQAVTDPYWVAEVEKQICKPGSHLAFGLGRSYGDSCLNRQGTLHRLSNVNKIVNFDAASGVLEAEAGIGLAEIINFALPQGWFLPVTPGTKFVTLGGAIANDIHGKNHHGAGTFGCFVDELKVLRSDGALMTCSSTENSELFLATIAGLGLTGIIVSATIRLKRVFSNLIDQRTVKFHGLDEFLALSAQYSDQYDYTVSWLDCVSTGDNFARGIFIAGNHHGTAESEQRAGNQSKSAKQMLNVPDCFPRFTLNRYSVKLFNELYYHKQLKQTHDSVVGYDPFFYPLDAVKNWNRIYGADGLLQFQCVIPNSEAKVVLTEILGRIVKSGKASFLAVLKEFGAKVSPGMMSFPRPGVTLCLDFVNSSAGRSLLLELDQIVAGVSDSACYPAKDALMPPASFRHYYPARDRFTAQIDPNFSSDFWRRVNSLD